jgi:hypothetical protein
VLHGDAAAGVVNAVMIYLANWGVVCFTVQRNDHEVVATAEAASVQNEEVTHAKA